MKVNELSSRREEVSNTYILIGAAKNKNNEVHIVTFVVNKFSNAIDEINVLYSANTKKRNQPYTNVPGNTDEVHLPTGPEISISELLEIVNSISPDILSKV